MKKKYQKTTAYRLLDRFLELNRRLDMKYWSEKEISENPPLLYRLQQLMALFKAIEMDWNPEAFIEGAFFNPNNPEYQQIYQEMLTNSPKDFQGYMGRRIRESDIHGLPYCFKSFLKYRIAIDEILSFSSGVYAASGLFLYAHLKVRDINAIIKDNISTIDEILVKLIDPQLRKISDRTLIKRYGYPNVNLADIDFEYF